MALLMTVRPLLIDRRLWTDTRPRSKLDSISLEAGLSHGGVVLDEQACKPPVAGPQLTWQATRECEFTRANSQYRDCHVQVDGIPYLTHFKSAGTLTEFLAIFCGYTATSITITNPERTCFLPRMRHCRSNRPILTQRVVK